MKEIRTKLDIYIPIIDDTGKEITKDEAYSLIVTALDKAKLSYQIYEQEIQD